MGAGDTSKKCEEIPMEEKQQGSRDGEGSSGDGSPSEKRDAEETTPCLSENNGRNTTVGTADSTDQDSKTRYCINLDKKWIFAGLIATIAAVIVISVFGCRGIRDNEDDVKIDRSAFTERQNFSGSLQLLQNLSFCETQELARLQEELVGLYNSSPALERFFEKAETFCSRNDSAVAQYHLTFIFPKEDEGGLKNFTLSLEMVYNVFRQWLYDQDPDALGNRFIDPDSLKMYIMH